MDRSARQRLAPAAIAAPATRAALATRATLAASMALATSAALGACDPRVFDDLAADTWVHSSKPPDGLSSQSYAIAIAGGGAAPDRGAAFFVAARLEDGLAYLRYDAGGALTASRLSPRDVTQEVGAVLPQDLVLAGDPASSRVAVTLTSSTAPARAWVALLDSDTGRPTGRLSLEGPESIAALGIGRTGVTGQTQDIVLVRRNTLVVLPDIARLDETSPIACGLGRPVGASLVMADLDPSSAADEIAFLADLEGSGAPQVIVTTGALVAEAAASVEPGVIAPCFADGRQPLLVITAPEGAADFGQRMLAADFNDNGIPDLVVSASGAGGRGRVYVYLDVDARGAGAGVPIEIPAPAEAEGFGLALAAGDLDGAGGHELAVGAPASARAGVRSAGAVYLYGFDDGGFGTPEVLADARPETDQRFGRTVAVVGFGSQREILVVGSRKEAFTYFRTPMSSDVRE